MNICVRGIDIASDFKMFLLYFVRCVIFKKKLFHILDIYGRIKSCSAICRKNSVNMFSNSLKYISVLSFFVSCMLYTTILC